MPTLKELFSKELDDLKTLRDEIRVKAHLARADMKDEIAKLRGLDPAEFVPTGLLRAYQETERGPHVPDEGA